MKRLSFAYILLVLFFLTGCTSNIKNISATISSTDSIIVGHIETVPVLWVFSLYEEKSKTEDQMSIEGQGFGFTKANKLQNEGYIFKVIRPGTYVLRVKKAIGGRYGYDDILRFEVPGGKLVYFGTIKIVIDRVGIPLDENGVPRRAPAAFKYHSVHIAEDETLKYFENQYPKVYSAHKDNIIRIPSPSRSEVVTLLTDAYPDK
jgi:hypothetical protein